VATNKSILFLFLEESDQSIIPEERQSRSSISSGVFGEFRRSAIQTSYDTGWSHSRNAMEANSRIVADVIPPG
jgi:hypothetical protein